MRDVGRRFLPEATNLIDLFEYRMRSCDGSAGLYPAIFSLRSVGRDSQQDGELGCDFDRMESSGDVTHEDGVVADVVIGGKDRHCAGMAAVDEATERAHDRGSRSAILRLDEEARRRSIFEQ